MRRAYLDQDTTEFDLTKPKQQVSGAGPLSGGKRVGFFYHPLYAVAAPGIPLGVFNVYDIEASAYLDKVSMEAVSEQLGLPTVPAVGNFSVPECINEILVAAEGKSVLNPKTEREGLVWVYGSGDDRISLKTISNRFLAKGGD